ncbi:hypothetical protein [Chromobacterium subtsugae]|uniref:hypothetical protein n=1 Tax=Chromobacterium subtsugae TaxID=251747 RepID=UPI000AD30E51|nr:hypothetical protein [Chromobacterium subtsugae]
MTENQLALLIIKGAIFELPPTERASVEQAVAELRQVVEKYPDGHGTLALALLGAEAGQ